MFHASFPHRLGTAIRAAGLALALGLVASSGSAQVTDNIDRSLLNTWRLNTGSIVRLCQFAGVPTAVFDRSVGEAVADRLLLDSEYKVLGSGYGIGGEYAGEDIYISLVNDCDILLGMGIGPNLYPQEIATTRPYIGFSYVGVTTDPQVNRLSDIASDRRLGARVASYGHTAVQRYIATLPQSRRWQLLPYGDIDLMVQRLVDGTLGAMIIYGPTLAEVMAEQPDLSLTLFSLQPETSAQMDIGGIMLTTNTYLRVLIDEAIVSLVADGTIEALIDEAGLSGIPHTPGGF